MGTKITVAAECADNRHVHVATNSPDGGVWKNLRNGQSLTVELTPATTLTVREMDLPKTVNAG